MWTLDQDIDRRECIAIPLTFQSNRHVENPLLLHYMESLHGERGCRKPRAIAARASSRSRRRAGYVVRPTVNRSRLRTKFPARHFHVAFASKASSGQRTWKRPALRADLWAAPKVARVARLRADRRNGEATDRDRFPANSVCRDSLYGPHVRGAPDVRW